MNYQVDLTNCDREPIHIPGKIQSHGFLIAVNSKTYNISYASKNIEAFTSLEATSLLGKNITEFEQQLEISGDIASLQQLLNLAKVTKTSDTINPLAIDVKGTSYNLIISHSTNDLVLEFEPTESDLGYDIQKTIGRSLVEWLMMRL